MPAHLRRRIDEHIEERHIAQFIRYAIQKELDRMDREKDTK